MRSFILLQGLIMEMVACSAVTSGAVVGTAADVTVRCAKLEVDQYLPVASDVRFCKMRWIAVRMATLWPTILPKVDILPREGKCS